jgi:small subunit ribosomal protein S4
LNGHKVDIPSLLVKPGDVISVRESSRSATYFKDRSQLLQGAVSTPVWLTLNVTDLSGAVAGLPAREDIVTDLNEQLIVEYYSR